MKSLRFPLIVVVALLTSAVSAWGGMINLTYSGADEDDSDVTSVGSGSFTFASGSTALTLANLSSFQFSQRTTIADPSLLGAATFSDGLSDLISFSATLSATGTLTALTFQTDYVDPTNSTFTPDNALAPEYFIVHSLRVNGANTFNGPNFDDELQTGTVVPAAAVPEPSSLVLTAVAGGLGLLVIRRRWAWSRSHSFRRLDEDMVRGSTWQ